MAPIALIVVGVVVYYLNNYKGFHIGIRGVPWIDAPTFFVVAGAIAFVIRTEIRRRQRARDERRARGEF